MPKHDLTAFIKVLQTGQESFPVLVYDPVEDRIGGGARAVTGSNRARGQTHSVPSRRPCR